jgi:peptide/nickel transport system permease protein
LLIPVLLGILIVVFALARAIPGDLCLTEKTRMGSPAYLACRARWGLDDDPLTQFVKYLGRLAQGDLGTSVLKAGRPVSDIILERLPMTVELTIGATVFAGIAGLILGIVSAMRHNSFIDVFTMVLANVGISMPVFWLGLMLIWLFAIALNGTPLQLPTGYRLSPGVYLPPLSETFNLQLSGAAGSFLKFVSNMYTVNALVSGRFDIFLDAIKHLILPAFAVGTIPLAIIARITRSSMLEVLGADYIRTARAKGLRENAVIMTHALRNALLPIVTVFGLQVGHLLAGAVLTETTFGLPGVGTQLVDAIQGRDYYVIQAFVVVIALGYVMVNLIVDLSYGFLDPRVARQ